MNERVTHLHGIVTTHQSRRDWSKLPDSFHTDAIKKLKEELKPHLRGNGNNEIKARTAVSKASNFDEIHSALEHLHGEMRKGMSQHSEETQSELGHVTIERARELVSTNSHLNAIRKNQ